LDIIIRYKLNLEIDNFKNSYQNLNEGREYEELLQREEQRIRKLSGIELTLKIQCEKYVQKINILEREKDILKSKIVRINFIINIERAKN
jgi:hypothetical protein